MSQPLRAIVIRPMLNGFLVEVGCQALAYTSREKLVLDLGDYLQNPDAALKRMLPEFINRKHMHPGDFDGPLAQPAPPAPAANFAGTATQNPDAAQYPPVPAPGLSVH